MAFVVNQPEPISLFPNLAEIISNNFIEGQESGQFSEVLAKTKGQEGDFIENLLFNLGESGLPLNSQKDLFQSVAPLATQRQRQSESLEKQRQAQVQDQQSRQAFRILNKERNLGFSDDFIDATSGIELEKLARQQVAPATFAPPEVQAIIKSNSDLSDDIRLSSQKARKQIEVAERVDELSEGGEAGVFGSLSATLRFLGVNIPLTASEAELADATLQVAGRIKDAIGGRLNQVEFEELFSGIFSVDKTSAANRRLAILTIRAANKEVLREEARNEILREQGPSALSDPLFSSKIEDLVERKKQQVANELLRELRVKEQVRLPKGVKVPKGQVLIRNADGQTGFIPRPLLKDALENGSVELGILNPKGKGRK